MASGDRYVEITREDLESWLRSNFGSGWNRDQRTAGVYLIHLSDSVAVKLTSSIGRNDRNKGLGKASMKLSLVSRLINRPPLNAKARDRKSFMRTKGWKKTWLAGVRHWQGVYEKSADFYDSIGRGEEPNKRNTNQKSYEPDPETLRKLRELWVAAKNDNYVRGFAEDVGKKIKDRPLTDKQQAFAEKQFRQYRISTERVVARYLKGLQ